MRCKAIRCSRSIQCHGSAADIHYQTVLGCDLHFHPVAGGGADGDDATVAGRHTVDFEGLSFAQGGHLNTNKNTNLPPGSTRTTDKVPFQLL